jgi:hypothetical protein
MSPKAGRTDLRLGSLLGTVGGGRYAVVVNMTQSVKDIIEMSPQRLLQKIKDKTQDHIEIIDLRNSPMVMPASFFYSKTKSGKFPKETIDHKAQLLRDHLNYTSPDTNWKNISERLSELWHNDASAFVSAMNDSDEPALKYPASDILKMKEKTLNQYASQAYGDTARSNFNPIKKKIHAKIKSYRKASVSYLENGDDAGIADIYQSILSSPRLPFEFKILVNNIHFDLRPQDMSEKDRQEIVEMRSFYGAQTTIRAIRSLESDEESRGRILRMIENDPDKQNLLEDIQKYIDDRKNKYGFNEDAKSFVHPWRNDLRAA